MSADVIGTSDPVQQPTRKHWDYSNGEITEERWEGAKAGIEVLYEAYKAVAGFMPTLDSLEMEKGRKGVLVARSVSDGEINYELFGNDLYKDVETAKYFSVDAPILNADDIMEVRQAITEQYTQAETGFAGKQLELWQLKAKGVEQYYETAYVLRETKNVSKRSTVSASFENVNRVDTPPTTSAVNTLIGALPAGDWLKKSPQVRLIGIKRWQIITEWWWASRWSFVIYGGRGVP